MKLKMMLLAGLMSMGLAGCGAPSVEDFAEDPALLQKTWGKCITMDPAKAKADETCVNAAIAMRNMQKNMLGNMMNMMGR